VTKLALEQLEADNPVESLRLTDVVLANDQKNVGALNARLRTLNYLKEHCKNYNKAGWLEFGIKKSKAGLASQ
jgi:hypothetical protein